MRAIAVSQRGHGDSDKPLAGYRVEDFAADCAVVPRCSRDRTRRGGRALGFVPELRSQVRPRPSRACHRLVLEASPTTLRGNADLTAFVESVVSGLEDPIDPSFAWTVVAETSSQHLASEVVDRLAVELMKVPRAVEGDVRWATGL